MDKFGGRKIKDIKTEYKNGQLVRVIIFVDGSKDYKVVGADKIEKMMDAIEAEKGDLQVIQGGKK